MRIRRKLRARALRRCRLPYDERVQVHADDDAARRVCLRAHGRRKLDGEVSERQGRVLRKLPHSCAIYLATRCYSVLYTFENALSGHECQICFDSCEECARCRRARCGFVRLLVSSACA